MTAHNLTKFKVAYPTELKEYRIQRTIYLDPDRHVLDRYFALQEMHVIVQTLRIHLSVQELGLGYDLLTKLRGALSDKINEYDSSEGETK